MADNNNNVTIEAAFFYELFRKANETDTICKECREEHTAEEFNALAKERDELVKELNIDAKKIAELANERDKLKAKLDAADVDRMTYADRAEAAERCIEECFAHIVNPAETPVISYSKIEDLIRAYSEKEEK